MNINQIMKQAQAMQKKIQEAQEKVAAIEISGSSGGGLVSVSFNGKGQAQKISVDASLIDPQEKEVLEDLIVAAINDAKNKLDKAANEEMEKVAGGIALPPGVNFPL